ncbi:MAG: bifunctional pyr operon transcriptional regulator/uracil phosphoribosyltransferase PyrR [Gaiellales bacterium]
MLKAPISGRFAARCLLDDEGIARTLARIAHELIERNEDLDDVALVGIHTRGVPIARRLQALVEERSGVELAFGSVDIAFHRDDVALRATGAAAAAQPVVHGTELPFRPEGKTCVLVDDVLSTGRTIRAAIDALLEFGRADRIQLAVLVDRGHRELPIRPDYVGKNVPTAPDERVQVLLEEIDGEDAVLVLGGAAREEARDA